MNPTVELVLKHKKANMRKSEFLMLEALKSAPHLNDIKEHHPELCSAAFVLECTKGRGRLVGAFAEASVAANAYRGDFLGLMAVHLLLLAVETVSPGLSGSATIYSDCIGALGRVAKLPPYRIPSRCRHSDILKTIMVNCASLSFQREYHHVVAHQDDHTWWEDLTRAAQLNLTYDAVASPPAGGIPTQAYLHVCRRKEDDFRYWCTHTRHSWVSLGPILFPRDQKDVSGRV